MSDLDRARDLARTRGWPELARLEQSVDVGELERCPELAYLIADALRRTGHADRARPLALQAEDGAHRLADPRLVLRAVNLLGMLEFEAGEMGEAEARFGELLERATRADDDEFAARASNNLGVLANIRGQTELALTSYQHALAAYHRIGYARGLAQTHYNLGISYRDLGFDEEADSHYERAIQQAELSDSEDVVALAETERAFLRARSGDGDLAESLGSRALSRLERMGDPAGAANAVRVLASAARARGDLHLALQRLDGALSTTVSHPDLLLRAEIQRDRGSVFVELADLPAATAAFTDSVEAYELLGAAAEAAATRSLLSSLAPPADAV